MFLTQIQIENCLNALESVHPFFGITFLVCKQENLPVGQTISFAINHKEDSFLKKHFKPEPDSECFYRPFRTSDKKQCWLRPDYASSGSQKSRTSTFSKAFIHET